MRKIARQRKREGERERRIKHTVFKYCTCVLFLLVHTLIEALPFYCYRIQRLLVLLFEIRLCLSFTRGRACSLTRSISNRLQFLTHIFFYHKFTKFKWFICSRTFTWLWEQCDQNWKDAIETSSYRPQSHVIWNKQTHIPICRQRTKCWTIFQWIETSNTQKKETIWKHTIEKRDEMKWRKKS